MDTAVVDLSRDSLSAAIVGNMLEALPLMCSGLGEVIRVEETAICFTGLPLAMFNGTVCPRFSPETADQHIDWIIEQARSRRVPMLWQIGPGSAPANLEERLRHRGMVAGGVLPGMAADLTSLSPEEPPEGVSISRIRDLDTLRASATLLCESFEIPLDLLDPLVRILAVAGTSDDAHMVHYGAGIDGKLVAVSSVIYGAGVAGIYNVATDDRFRGRGIGRAVTLAPLLDARRKGYRVGILQSSTMGLSVYRRLGFEHYCDFTVYVWSDAPKTAAQTG
jgi:predicted GNAT family acetyltransferase